MIINFSKENITFLIAVIGFFLSVLNFIKNIMENRFKLKLEFKSAGIQNKFPNNPIYFEMLMENCSRLPVSIARIFLKIGSEQFEFDWKEHEIYCDKVIQNQKIVTTKTHYSSTLPHTIEGLGIWGRFFYVKTNETFHFDSFLKNNNTLILYTNRGKKKLKLPSISVNNPSNSR